jgi:endonuclease/exonuclease/phosphatase family metal-dependent hydrolase
MQNDQVSAMPTSRRLKKATHLLCLAVAGCLVLSISASAERLTIGTYNLQNFFDVYNDPYTEDESAQVKPRREVQALARAIEAMKADVIVFQELENEHLLKAMVGEFLPAGDYRYIASIATNSSRGINLGVISRHPIASVTSHRFQTLTHPERPRETWRFARDLMRIELNIEGIEPVVIYNVHLKSNRSLPRDEFSILFRTAEAMRVRQIIDAELDDDPDFLAIVAGDFNSNYETRPEQPRPWPAMAHLLAPTDSGKPVLFDVHVGLSDDDRVTIPGSGRYPPATFDYILATPAMATRYIKDSARVIQDAELTQGSDHYPVVASFDLSRR